MKNIKAKLLTLIVYLPASYSLDKNKEAVNAIVNQTSSQFNLMFVFDGYSQSLMNEIEKIDFSSKNIHVNHVIFFAELGSAYAFNYAFKNISTPFGYFFDASIILKNDFVSNITTFLQRKNNLSLLSFYVDKMPYEPTTKFTKIEKIYDDFSVGFIRIVNNCVFNKQFLQKHKIWQTNFRFYLLQFYLDIVKCKPEWYRINKQLAKYIRNKQVSYNIFDMYDQCLPIFEKLQTKDTFEFQHSTEVEYLCVVYLLHNFLVTIFKNHPDKTNIQKQAIDFVAQAINTYAHDWFKNKWLNSKYNKNNKRYLSYVRKFKPYRFYVKQAIKSGIFNGK